MKTGNNSLSRHMKHRNLLILIKTPEGLSVCPQRLTSRCLCTGGTWRGCIPGPRCCFTFTVLYCTVLYCTVVHCTAKVVLTVRDPVRWHHSVKTTIREVQRLLPYSWLALPLRPLMALPGGHYIDTSSGRASP